MLIGANLIVNEATPSIIDLAQRAEDRGMNCIFQGEHSHIPVTTVYPATAGTGGKIPEFYRRFPDVFVTLAAAAAVTTRIRLGTGVALVAEHNSFHLAKATATLDRISGGRLDFGVGYGWNPPELANNGVPWEDRRQALRALVPINWIPRCTRSANSPRKRTRIQADIRSRVICWDIHSPT